MFGLKYYPGLLFNYIQISKDGVFQSASISADTAQLRKIDNSMKGWFTKLALS